MIGFDDERRDYLDRLLACSLVTASTKVEDAVDIIKVDGIVVGTVGNFSVSIGKAKSKKTFNVSALVAAAVFGRRILNYEVKMPVGKPLVLYFDTEQSQVHCVKVVKRINRLCGHDSEYSDPYLYFFGLRRYSPVDRLDAISLALEQFKGQVGLVIIDGIRDCLYDINSPSEATTVVGHLLKWSEVYECHIHTILHQNKSDENARGHIGTELNNKAETVLKVEKSKEQSNLSVVSPLMCREREFAPFAFFVDDCGLPQLDEEYTPETSASSGRKAFDPWTDIPKATHARCLERLFPEGKGRYSSNELIQAMLDFYREEYPSIGRDKVKLIKTRFTNLRVIIHEDEKSQKSPFVWNKLMPPW